MFGRKKHKHVWRDVFLKNVAGAFNIPRKAVVVYCPICDKRKEVSEEEWHIIRAEQMIKHEFKLKEGDEK